MKHFVVPLIESFSSVLRSCFPEGRRMRLACRIGILVGLCGPLCRAAEPTPPALTPLPTENRPLAERFAVPPPSARILRILHAQKQDPAQQDRQLRVLAAQGFGGFAGNVAFDGYVDDETKWPAFVRGVRLAKAAGMSLWLYDECGYPSGSARDLTLRGHPEWAARGLLVAEANTSGGEVSLALPPGQLVLAAALPRREGSIVLEEARDLAASIHGGRLSWQAPAGDWFVLMMTDELIYEGTHAALSLALKKPCIDLLTPEPTARFLEVTHERYAEKLGQDLGRYFVSTFTDEPSLQNLWLRPMPYRVLPWSLSIEREFAKRRGRALRPLLPALVADAGPAGARARYDFWNTVGELVSENYFGQIQTWCHKHNLLSGGHLLMEESLVGHVPLYGHFFRCVRRLDAPSIDCLTSLPPQVPWHVARMIGSAADLEGRVVTMCEVSDHSQRYRPKGDTRPVQIVTENEIRGTCNRLVWGGINTLTSYYSFQGLADESLQRINAHVGRCQTMLRGGHQVTDIAVVYPVESVWPRFVPAHRGATDEPAARRVENVFDGVGSALYGANRDFGYVDSQALCKANVSKDALTLGGLRWRVLVLPAADTLPLEAWEKVAAFWRQGGVVIAVGARPANSEVEFPSPRVQAIGGELFGTADAPCLMTNPAGGVGLRLPTSLMGVVPRIIDSLFQRDAACAEAKAPVKIMRRRIDGHEVYFAINDSDAPWEGKIRFCGQGVSEQWDPATGVMTPVADGVLVPVRLGPYGAMLFRSATAGVPKRLGRTVAASLSLTCEPLPKTPKPTASQAKAVRSEVTGDGVSGWHAAATLTEGQVDTFLFLNFPYAEPLNLTANDGLAIDVAVPQGQRTPAELLVFLQTASGDRFLAGTGHYLNVPGASRAYVMFNQFRPFGQSHGELNLSKITSISIGWGGYLGTADERILFTVKPPQRFSAALPASARVSRTPQAAPLLEKQGLFEARTGGYHTYRVPGLLVTQRGVVLATAEARREGSGDWGDNDVLLRRSLDGGRTWDKPRLIVAQKTYGPGPISNFVMLSERGTGTVHALFCYDYRRVFHIRSEDDGATFSAPVEITPALEGFRRDYPWKVIATGPAHGTQLRSGRFIVPVWMSDGSGKEMGKGKLGHRPSIVSLIYSDDQGRSWRCGDIVCRNDARFRNPSETVVVELADGRVLFNIRSESKENRRLVSISRDGVRGWSEPRFDPALLEPVCMASLLRLSWPEGGQRSRILFANPDNLENDLVKPGGNLAHDRKRLTVKMSYDECRTWPASKVLEQGPSGYSDLAMLPDGTVLCIYECGMLDGMTLTKSVTLARFNLEWLSEGHE